VFDTWQAFPAFQLLWVRPGAYPSVEHLKVSSLGPYSQTLDYAGKATRDKHSSLSRTFVYYSRKKFCNIGPCMPPFMSLIWSIYKEGQIAAIMSRTRVDILQAI